MAIQLRDKQGNKVNKYIKERIIQGNYGNGWDDLCTSSKADFKAYRANEPQYAHRIIERRSINPIWVELNKENDLIIEKYLN